MGMKWSGPVGRESTITLTARAGAVCFSAVVLVPLAGGCMSDASVENKPFSRIVAEGPLAVFADEDDLWLWSAEDGRTRRLTSNGAEPAESQPRFSLPRTVTFIADGALYALGIAGGTPRLVVSTKTVVAYAWSPNRDILAFVVQPGGVGPHELYLLRSGEKRTTLVRRFSKPTRAGQTDGDGRTVDGEVSLAWSPGGTRILLVDTDLLPEATVYVFGADGRERKRLRATTHAGWIDDDRFYARTLRGAAWSVVDLRRGTRPMLTVALGRMHPALSPDRRLLAFDSGRPWRRGTLRRGCACTLSLLDLVTGRERSLGTGLIAPRWLAQRTLVATAVRGCSGADVPMWVERGRSIRLNVRTGERAEISLRSTLDADVRFAP